MRFDVYRRGDGALVAVPSRLSDSMITALAVRFVRTTDLDLDILSDAFVAEMGLYGFAVARGADAALLRTARLPDAALGHVE